MLATGAGVPVIFVSGGIEHEKLGVAPGQMLVVQAPDGQKAQVTVPHGVMPGQQMAVQMPVPVPAMAMGVDAEAVVVSVGLHPCEVRRGASLYDFLAGEEHDGAIACPRLE